MYKINSILFISSNPSEIANHTHILKEFSIANEVKVFETIETGTDYIDVYGKVHEGYSPEFIFLDLSNLLEEGINFLESFSSKYIRNKESVRIIFLTSSHESKEVNTLKVLGDFEFLDRPFSQESFFNCLVSLPSFE